MVVLFFVHILAYGNNRKDTNDWDRTNDTGFYINMNKIWNPSLLTSFAQDMKWPILRKLQLHVHVSNYIQLKLGAYGFVLNE